MAEGDFKISQMTELPFNTGCEFIADDPDGGDYATKTHTLSEISTTLLNSFQYTQDLDTTDKKIVGAVAELVSEVGIILKAHCEPEYGVIITNPIFLDSNIEIEVYSDNTSGISRLFVQGNQLWIMYADTSEAYDLEVIARHGLV